jgi:hypothetical protein
MRAPGASTRHRTFRMLAAGLALACMTAPAAAQPTEQAVKAAFLPKFVRYINWPPPTRPAPGTPFQLCIIGDDTLGRLLDEAAVGQNVDQHPIVIRRMATTAGAAGCHVAFVTGSAAQSVGDALAALQNMAVLTITDARAGAKRGMIHFALQKGHVRFHIDDAAAATHNLNIDSRLLSLALSVRQRPS